jgi:GTP-binding protein HflX
LSEAREADLLLHVVDCSDPLLVERVHTVERVLEELDCDNVPTLIVANKCDCEGAPVGLAELRSEVGDVLAISAATGEGCDDLLQAIQDDMSSQWETIELFIPYEEGALLNKIKLHSHVLKETVEEKGILFQLEIAPNIIDQWNLRHYQSTESL